MEIWKSVKGFEGKYEVSNKGNVRSVERIIVNSLGVKKIYKSHIMKPSLTKSGYFNFVLRENGKKFNYRLNRMVADAFIPNINNKPYVNHKNGNKTNNEVENLEWVTGSENTKHAYNNKLITHFRKLSKEDVEKIRKIYVFNSKEYSIPKLSKMFNCSKTSIWNVINNKGSYENWGD